MTDPTTPEPAAPPPTFDILPLSQETKEALAQMGYTHPTPVQRVVFEPAIRGADLVVQARTGTGKTAAFGLPIVESVVHRKQRALQAIVLCPTRELALQVTGELGRLARPRGIEPVAIYGGAPMGKQVDALSAGAQVVIGTPGRVLDHLQRGTMRADDVRLLVLDEADEMLSMGFERELSAILERLPKGRQTLLFSATMPPDIERMARDRLKQPEFITLSGDHVGALEILHFVYVVPKEKTETLMRIVEVENPESAIVFCNTKAETERVAEAFEKQGFAADWLNGDLPQGDREKVMARTREGKLRFLVATDVAARGIDISHLSHVINFDFPDTAEQYIHRTGRTGRMGRTGSAISLIAPKDIGNLYLLRLTYKIRPIERQIPTEGELKTRAETDLVQLLSEAFVSRQAHPDDLALARRLLSHDAAEHIVAGLVRDHLGVRGDAADVAAAARRSKMPPEVAGPAVSLADWTPPVEPGDDQPIFAGSEKPAPRTKAAPRPKMAPPAESDEFRWTERPHDDAPEASFAEIFVNVGRRDGVAAADLQHVLTEVAKIPAAQAGRIRVRERNAFVSVKREMLDRALAALNGAAIAGKVVQAEPAKPRSS